MTDNKETIEKLLSSSTLPPEKLKAIKSKTDETMKKLLKSYNNKALAESEFKALKNMHERELIKELWEHSKDKELQQKFNDALNRLSKLSYAILNTTCDLRTELSSEPTLEGKGLNAKLSDLTQIIHNASFKFIQTIEKSKSGIKTY